MMNTMMRQWIFSIMIVAFGAGGWAAEPAVLLSDDYRAMAPGMISSDVVGARTEYHYLAATAPRGNWAVSAFRTDVSQRAWRLIEENGERLIWQSCTESDRERPYTHPMLIAGDELWTDYTMEVRFAPESDQYQSGVVFRYHTSRVHYFAGVVGQKAVITKINNGVAFRKMDVTVLAESPLSWKPGEFIALKVTVEGDKLTADFGHGVRLEAHDASFRQGKIGFTSDVPTKYSKVVVTCSAAVKAAYEQKRQARIDEESRLQADNPKLVLWKKISTRGFGSGRNLRFGDLDGDGKIDILVVQQNAHGPGDAYSEVGSMTALTLDGKILWQSGLADAKHDQLTNDVAVEIHDIDGDGKNEVVYCRDMEIVVADGATGKTKYKAPTPLAPPGADGKSSRFPRILGDAIYFCDFRGLGAARDFIVKDRYQNVWAYTDKLEPLWHLALNTGHYPYAFDSDGDGKDELAIGYSFVSHEGKIIWNLEKQLADDHADGVAIVSFKDGAPPTWMCVASDDGYLRADLKGTILEHLELGHMQNPTVAKFRPDMPGLQTVTVNFLGQPRHRQLF